MNIVSVFLKHFQERNWLTKLSQCVVLKTFQCYDVSGGRSGKRKSLRNSTWHYVVPGTGRLRETEDCITISKNFKLMFTVYYCKISSVKNHNLDHV